MDVVDFFFQKPRPHRLKSYHRAAAMETSDVPPRWGLDYKQCNSIIMPVLTDLKIVRHALRVHS